MATTQTARRFSPRTDLIALSLLLVLLQLAVFSCARLALYFLHFSSHFHVLDISDVISAFVAGLRFDLSIGSCIMGLPILMLQVDLSQSSPRFALLWQRFWLSVYYLFTCVLVLLLAGDVFYFGYVKRHAYDELMLLKSDWRFMVTTAWQSFTFIFSSIVLATVAGLVAIVASFGLRKSAGSLRQSALRVFVALVFFGCAIRGSFSLKPISIVDAYTSGNAALGDLTLNGAFTMLHGAIKASAPLKTNFFPQDQALKYLEDVCGKTWKFPAPFAYSVAKEERANPRNIVVILLESWFNPYLGSYGSNRFPNLTPEFDRLAAHGTKFENFFANGSRSIEAIQAILTGFPALQGIPDLGVGFELGKTPALGRMAKTNQYQSLFIQSSPRRSFRLDAVAMALGFERYFGLEDYKLELNYQDSIKPLFGYDYEMLQLLAQETTKLKPPFISFAFTGTTHTPFIRPPQLYQSEGHETENEVGFINTMHYADSALGAYFKSAATQPWFTDTTFIITADHTFPKFLELPVLERYRVPLVIVDGEDLLSAKPGTTSQTYASHVDILPTIVERAGWTGNFAASGRAIEATSTEQKSCVFLANRFGNPVIATPRGYLEHNLDRRLATSQDLSSCDDTCLNELEHALLAYQQIMRQAYRLNDIGD